MQRCAVGREGGAGDQNSPLHHEVRDGESDYMTPRSLYRHKARRRTPKRAVTSKPCSTGTPPERRRGYGAPVTHQCAPPSSTGALQLGRARPVHWAGRTHNVRRRAATGWQGGRAPAAEPSTQASHRPARLARGGRADVLARGRRRLRRRAIDRERSVGGGVARRTCAHSVCARRLRMRAINPEGGGTTDATHHLITPVFSVLAAAPRARRSGW